MRRHLGIPLSSLVIALVACNDAVPTDTLPEAIGVSDARVAPPAGCLNFIARQLLTWDVPGPFPTDIAIGTEGNVYTIEQFSFDVRVFDTDGNLLDSWNVGFGDDENFAVGLGVDPRNGDIYVVMANPALVASEFLHIFKFRPDGTFLGAWGEFGSGGGEFDLPQDVAIDRRGFVYVIDSGNFRVQKLTPDGEQVTQWGGLFPGGRLAVSGGGYAYVVSADGLFKYSPGGALLFSTPSASGSGVALDADEIVYVARGSSIQMLTSNLVPIAEWGEVGQGIAVDHSRHAFILENELNLSVQKWIVTEGSCPRG